MSYQPPPEQPPHIPYYTPGHAPYYNPRPTSVTVLAILGIIFGALGLICMPIMLLALFIPQMAQEMDMQYEGAALGANVALFTLHLVLSLVLLVSSIAALRLHPLGRKGMIWEEAASLVLLPVGIAMFVVWDLPALQASDEPEAMAGLIGGIIGSACSFVITLAYAICVLYFMTRPHVKGAFGEAPAEEWPPQVPPYQPPP